jgi:iron complex outermembrane receptor protein
MNIPIVSSLEGNAAVRYDHYSDFGSTTNPKFSLRWQPAPSVLFRVLGPGFLAPTLYQLWSPTTPGLSQAGVSDPLRCPDQTDRETKSIRIATRSTDNDRRKSNLQPEKANQTMIGGVWGPGTA